MTGIFAQLLAPCDGKQTVFSITRAEVRKLLAPGGIRFWLVVAAILAISSGVLAVAMSGVEALKESGGIAASDVASTGPVLTALVLCLAVIHHVTREVGDGTVMSARCLVPRTKNLFIGRMLAWCLVGAVMALITAVAPLPATMLWGEVVPSSITQIIVVIVTSIMLAALLVGLSHAAATMLQRGAVVVAVMMMLLVVIPLVVTVGGVLASGAFATALLGLGRIALGSLVVVALQIPTQDTQSWGTWVRAVAGLVLWLVVSTVLAYIAFRRPSYGDR